MLSTFSIAPFRTGELPPGGIVAASTEAMRAMGWQWVRHAQGREAGEILRQTILDAWPDAVRVTRDGGRLAIWRKRERDPTEAFPNRAEVELALRVVEAVGIARAVETEDAVAAVRRGRAGARATGRRALEENQQSFERVAEALRRYLHTP